MADHRPVFESVRRGMIPAHIYNDKELFELEKERLFSRAWLYVGHESEIPQDGDYVVRRVLDDSFILTRDGNGDVRALFNMCLHRGMQVCRAEMGNASNFRCPYHGWTYRNDGRLTGLPFHREAYGGDDGFPKQGQTLVPAPNLASYNGLLFINMDPHPQPLADFLGDFRFYLDFYTKQSPGGLEVRGPQRWRIKANWKIGAENFAGDMYHTPQTHASIVEIGLFREPKAQKRKDGATYWAHCGGGTTYKLPPGNFEERMRYVGYPDEMIDRIKRVWTQEQQQLVGEDGFMISAASCFPNLSFVHNWPKVLDGADDGCFAVHFDPVVAADLRERNRGVLVVRSGLRRTAGVQKEFLQGLPDVLRIDGNVRARRRGELGVVDQHRRRLDGATAVAEQPDGLAFR